MNLQKQIGRQSQGHLRPTIPQPVCVLQTGQVLLWPQGLCQLPVVSQPRLGRQHGGGEYGGHWQPHHVHPGPQPRQDWGLQLVPEVC